MSRIPPVADEGRVGLQWEIVRCAIFNRVRKPTGFHPTAMTTPSQPRYLRAFVSSTYVDLREHRAYVIDQLRKSGLAVDPMEDWTADSDEPQAFSQQRVEGCDLCVLLVAFRRGCVPPGETRSITQLEYERACALGMEILVFLLDDEAPWPRRYDEMEKDPALVDWRRQLRQRHGVGTFGLDSNSVPINPAVARWLQKLRAAGRATPVDELRYLRGIHKQTAWIDIRGLQVGAGRAHRFPRRDLIIPLAAVGPVMTQREAKGDIAALERAERRVDLHESLRHRHLVIGGDPGAGKTTLLRRIACEMCELYPGVEDRSPLAPREDGFSSRGARGLRSDPPAAWLAPDERPLPIFVRLSDLNDHIRTSRVQGGAPTLPHQAGWLPHFLCAAWREACPDADEAFFRSVLEQGRAAVLLDGLDEAPSESDRRTLVQLIESAATAYDKCRFVVTSRPTAVQGHSVLPGFAQVAIAPLEMDAVEVFLGRWCDALFPEDADRAEKHLAELLTALRSRADIRRLARNPVMLTALAVVHWNEKRLPEQRADLYESIIKWLAQSRDRESRPGRVMPERCVGLLQNLALAMQDHPSGRQVQVRRRWAAEQIAGAFRAQDDPQERSAAAARFLADEELDSGIVVARGDDDVRFWHLTFQEYLAARALAACDDSVRRQRLLGTDKPYQAEWREVFLLLAGVLHHHGMERVDQMIRVVIDRLGATPENGTGTDRPDRRQSQFGVPLAQQARCVGLLGAAVRDLTPVKYRPSEPRYEQMLDQVLAIFDAEKSRDVPIQDAIAAADALGQAGDPRFAGSQADNLWVTIPAGEFWMGAQKRDPKGRNHDPEADGDEAPVHRVYLDCYRIGRYPVTVDQYRLFVENGCYELERLWDAGGFGKWTAPDGWDQQLEHPNWPVAGVSWFEAQAYCRWTGYRLPTEAEWERAARGGDERRYPWGNDEPAPTRMNYATRIKEEWKPNVGHPTPVGVYPQGLSSDGIADMAGNVWEWCQDSYARYTEAPVRTAPPSEREVRRVVRGGSWRYNPRFCRVSYRVRDVPSNRGQGTGFRVVCVLFGQDSSRKS